MIEGKQEIFEKLRAAGIGKAIVGFSGSGDEGWVGEEIEYFSLEGEKIEEIEDSLEKELCDFAENVIEHQHDGWENNDGASGEVTFDVAAGTIHLEFNEYYQSSTKYEEEY